MGHISRVSSRTYRFSIACQDPDQDRNHAHAPATAAEKDNVLDHQPVEAPGTAATKKECLILTIFIRLCVRISLLKLNVATLKTCSVNGVKSLKSTFRWTIKLAVL